MRDPDDVLLDDLRRIANLVDPVPRCPHCGRTSHGFVCCGALFADEPGGCPWDHGVDTADPTRPAPKRGESGPPRPARPPKSIRPRGAR